MMLRRLQISVVKSELCLLSSFTVKSVVIGYYGLETMDIENRHTWKDWKFG
jgi:hypothetical protein